MPAVDFSQESRTAQIGRIKRSHIYANNSYGANRVFIGNSFYNSTGRINFATVRGKTALQTFFTANNGNHMFVTCYSKGPKCDILNFDKTELKDMAGLWLFDEGSAKWSKIVPVTITFRPGSKYSA
jgi:hypothetical protein